MIKDDNNNNKMYKVMKFVPNYTVDLIGENATLQILEVDTPHHGVYWCVRGKK